MVEVLKVLCTLIPVFGFLLLMTWGITTPRKRFGVMYEEAVETMLDRRKKAMSHWNDVIKTASINARVSMVRVRIGYDCVSAKLDEICEAYPNLEVRTNAHSVELRLKSNAIHGVWCLVEVTHRLEQSGAITWKVVGFRGIAKQVTLQDEYQELHAAVNEVLTHTINWVILERANEEWLLRELESEVEPAAAASPSVQSP